MKKDIWKKKDFIRKEGIFTGTVVRIRPMLTANGAHILVRLEGSEIPLVNEKEIDDAIEKIEAGIMLRGTGGAPGTAAALKRVLYKEAAEEAESAGAVKIAVYADGWKYADDLGETDEQDIDSLLRVIKPGHLITFRLSKNWRAKNFYCRYLKDESLGLYSGYESEADWRQSAHAYPYLKEDGEYLLTILRKDFITDDFNKGMLSMEVCLNTDREFQRLRLLSLSGSESYKALSEIPADEIYKKKYLLSIIVDAETGKAYADGIRNADGTSLKTCPIKPDVQNKRRRKKKSEGSFSTHAYDYRVMREKAMAAERLKASELDLKKSFYLKIDATVRDDGVTDFNTNSFKFLPLKLSDGREICPEIRARTKRGRDAALIGDILGTKNQLTETSRMFPGTKVTCYFTPDLKKKFLLLRFLEINDTEDEFLLRRLEYYRKTLVRNGILPASELKVVISRMDEEERAQYEEILHSIEKRYKKSRAEETQAENINSG